MQNKNSNTYFDGFLLEGHMKEKIFAIPEYTTAEDIKDLRKRLKLTQKEFAELICCGK